MGDYYQSVFDYLAVSAGVVAVQFAVALVCVILLFMVAGEGSAEAEGFTNPIANSVGRYIVRGLSMPGGRR